MELALVCAHSVHATTGICFVFFFWLRVSEYGPLWSLINGDRDSMSVPLINPGLIAETSRIGLIEAQ